MRNYIISVLFAVWVWHFYSFLQLFAEWEETDLPEYHILLNSFKCSLAPGIEELSQDFAGSEDVEISRTHNLAVATIGLRYVLFQKDFEQPKFQGIFIYNLQDLKNPVKIQIPNSNPHGISLFESGKTLRIFIVSHNNGENNGHEETIIIDYLPETGSYAIINRISHSSLFSVNDIKAISNNEFIASNDKFFDWRSPFSKILVLGRLPLTNIVYVKLDSSLQSVVETRTLYRGFHGANGLEYNNGYLYVNDPAGGAINKLKWNGPRDQSASLVKTLKFPKGFFPDNLSKMENGKGFLVAGWANAKELLDDNADKRYLRSLVLSVNFDLEETKLVLKDYDRQISASVAADFDGNLFVGAPHRPLNLCIKE